MKIQKLIFWVLVLGIYLGYYACKAAEYTVVDGDSLEYGTERIRLYGIDAPEYFQECRDSTGQNYACGLEAKNFLQQMISSDITCKRYGTDRYGRALKECFSNTGESLNRKMVSSGWAVSYGDKYTPEESKAKKQKKGLWQGKFMRPELFRALSRNQQKKIKR